MPLKFPFAGSPSRLRYTMFSGGREERSKDVHLAKQLRGGVAPNPEEDRPWGASVGAVPPCLFCGLEVLN
jgi:hypothetical protein